MKQRNNEVNELKQKLHKAIKYLEKGKTPDNKTLVNLLKEIQELQIAPSLQNESLFRTTLYSIGDAVITTDIKGSILQMNHVAEKLCGWKESEAKNKPLEKVFNIISEATGKKLQATYKKVIKTGKITGLANRTLLISKSGNKIPIADSSAPIKNDKGEIIGVVLVFRDQTEERKNQIDLEERERKYSTLISNLPGFTYRCLNDKKWTIVYISEVCKKITGYSQNDFVRKKTISFNDLIVESYQKSIRNKWHKVLKDKSFFEFEYPIINKSGKLKWLWERGRGVYSLDGKLLFLEGFIEDISERKLAQESLELKNIIFESSITANSAANLDGKIIDANAAFLKCWGYSQKTKVIGKQLYKFIKSKNDVETILTSLNKKGFWRGDFIAIRKDGSEFIAQAVATAIVSSDGNIIGYQSSVIDISDQKRTEELLKESEHRYKAFFDNAPDAIFLADPESGNIIDSNKEALKLLKMPYSKVIGMHQSQLHPKRLSTYSTKSFNEQIKVIDLKIPFENFLVTATGEEIPVEVLASILTLNGKKVIQGVFRNISERRNIETALLRSQETLQNILAQFPGIVFWKDVNSIYLGCNQAFAAGAGLNSPAEIIGKTDFDLPWADTEAEYYRDDDKDVIVNTKTKRHIIEKQHQASGKITWFDTNKVPIKDNNGKVIGVLGISIDITERINTEKALHSSEEKFRSLFEQSSDAMLLLDGNVFFDCNKAALDLMGCNSKEQLLFLSPAKLSPDFQPDGISSVKKAEKLIKQAYKEGAAKFEWVHKKISGEDLIVDVMLTSVPLEDKQILFTIWRDITQRKAIEAEVQKSKDRMQLLIEGTPHLFFYVQNLMGNVEYISPSVENITGYSVKQWLNQNHWYVSDSPINHKAKERTKAHLAGTVITDPFYVEILHANGNKVMIEVYERPILADGKVIGLQGVAHDITKHQLAEQSLKESEISYRGLFDSVSEAIYILNESGIFLDVNKGSCIMYGYDRDELIGKTPEDVSASGKNDLQSVAISLGKAFKGEKQQFEFWGKRKNGEEFLKDVRLYPGNYFNKNVVIAIANDITEKKKAEFLLRESEKRYKLIAENTADCISVFDLKLNYTYISPSVSKLLGYTSGELMSLGIEKIISPNDFNDLQNVLLEELENEINGNADRGRSRIFELEQFCKNGSKVWIEATVSFLRGDDDAPNGILAVSRDITGRKEVESALALSEERYRAISNLTSDYLFSTQADDNGVHSLVWIAGSFEKITGYTVDEYKKVGGWRATIHPDELKLDDLDLEKLKRNEKVNREIKTFHKNGSLVWVKSYAQPIWDNKNNKLLGVYGAVEDITKRKQTEIVQKIQYNIADAVVSFKTLTELFESIRQELSAIINVNNFFIAIYDEATGMLRSDVDKDEVEEISEWPAKGSMTGYVIEQNKSLLLTKKDINQLINSRKAGMIGVIPEIWLGVPFKISGKVIGVLVVQSYDNPNAYDESSIEILEIVAHELSIYIQHKKAEEETSKLSAAIVQSPTIVMITDPSGNIEYVNPKFSEITGYSLAEVKSKNPNILKSGIHKKEFYNNLWSTLLSGKIWQGEFQNKKKSGDIYWENAIIAPIINSEGVITNYIAVKEDITEKKKMIEELIFAKEKAEEMNRVKSSFFANMSHELRTPMVGILGFSEFLMNELKDNSNYFTMVNSINVSGHRLLETLNLILNLSKLEASKVEVNLQSQNIVTLLEESFGFFESAAAKKSIEYSFSNDYPEIICNVDQQLFTSIFNNLINNAIKFTDSGNVTISVTSDSESVNISVSDTGVGISEMKQNLIWEEFRQASEGYNRGFEGTGLGLTIAKKYADLMNGNITVKSTLGKGTTFNVTFPLSNSASTQSNLLNNTELNKPVESIQNNPQIKILYVEDDEISVKYVTTITKNLYDVDSAKDSDEALNRVKQKKYDAILMDINLHRGMDGLELTKVIRKIDGYQSVPIIAITAFAMGQEKEIFLSKGMTHYLSKPFVKNQLLNLLDSAIDKK
ncbi:MAG: PAS domain S-box protein [Ignavibacteriales bacterium]|nr:PAS domain S-box protein [Ignavibacteriales bacterium]